MIGSSTFLFYFIAHPSFPKQFVACPIFRINIYGVYFVKIEKIARPILARPKRKKLVMARPLARPYIRPPVVKNSR